MTLTHYERQLVRAAVLAAVTIHQVDRKVVGSIRGCSTVDLFKVLLPIAYSSPDSPADEAGMLRRTPTKSFMLDFSKSVMLNFNMWTAVLQT